MPAGDDCTGDRLLIDDEHIRVEPLNRGFDLRQHRLGKGNNEILPQETEGLGTAQALTACRDIAEIFGGGKAPVSSKYFRAVLQKRDQHR